jgi:hypothetical protein
MACVTINDLPSASASLTGLEVVPLQNASLVTQKTRTGAIAISATPYDAVLTYATGYQVEAADGNVYRALQSAVGQTPETSPLYWKLILVTVPTTLTVPSVHSTIISALTALNEAVLTATVTIQVANGAYNYTTTQINLAHPYGRFISITGNTGTPASCSLSFAALPSPPTSPYLNPNSGSIYSSGPSGVTINGFSVLKSGGAPVFGHCGILASDGALINVGTNMIVNGFYGDMVALNGGVINATGVDLVTAGNTYALVADNGTVIAPGSAITGAGNGALIQRSGVVRMNNSTIDSAIVTAVTMSDGTVELPATTIGNVATFYDISGAHNTINDDTATFGTASLYDISLLGEMAYNGAIITADGDTFSRSQIVANTVQLVTDSGGASVFLDGAGSNNGLDAVGADLTLAAGTNVGVTVFQADGGVAIPVTLTIGTTNALSGVAQGTATLNGSGVALVAAPWVTNATTVVAISQVPSLVGPLNFIPGNVIPGVSFEIESSSGATDSGLGINWIAVVEP